MNREKFNKIYKDVLSYWPIQIDVREKTLFENGGADIPNLTHIHDKIEDSFPEYTDNNRDYIDWSAQVAWCIYTLLHQKARKSDCENVFPKDLSQEEIFNLFLENEDYLTGSSV